MRNKIFFGIMIFFFILVTLTACSKSDESSLKYITGVTAISAGDKHTVALKNDGTVLAWGLNSYGQLGDGTSTDSDTAVPVRALTGVTAISAGGYRTVALRNDGTVWAWGYNFLGELGDGTNTHRNTPVQVGVGVLTGITAIAAGDKHTVALKNDGTVWAWGNNSYGQLGDGTTTNSNTPVQAIGLTGIIKAISAGDKHTVALKNDGTVWAWGLNFSGQLGDDTKIDSNTPVQVIGLTGIITAISAGVEHTVALKNDGTVWAWGSNGNGRLGNGTMTGDSSIPVLVSGLTDVIAISAGGAHTVAVKDDGTVWAWGLNSSGQLGDETSTDRDTPVPVNNNLTGIITSISAGGAHTVALRDDSTVWSWGLNFSGQLGDGTKTNRNTPVQVKGW